MHPYAKHYLTAAAELEADLGPNPESRALKSASLTAPVELTNTHRHELDSIQEQIADAETNGKWAVAAQLKTQLLRSRKALGL